MPTLNRRQFLHTAGQTALSTAAAAALLLPNAAPATDSAPAKRPEVVVVYYPHWHVYDHGCAWKGEGWTEWEGVKAAKPRFPGHNQPLKPTWGYFDESDPQWAAREIDLATEHGVDVFLYDWYWYSGVRNMEEALEQGFLKAPNSRKMKFALMWANHDRRDQFCPVFGQERTVWLPSRHSPRDLHRVIDYCAEHYFKQPNYWRPEGRLFFSLFQSTRFVKELGGPQATRALFDEIDQRLGRAGLPPMHWNAMVDSPAAVPPLAEAGFRSTSRYNVNTAKKVQPDCTERYEDVMEAHRAHWEQMRHSPLVDLPVVTTGWDVTPRCRADVPWPFPYSPKSTKSPYYEYPYVPVVVGNTPARFEQLLRDVAQHLASDPRKPFAVVVNAWNEWTEGGYLLPDEHDGAARLEAIRRVFALRASVP